MELETRKTSTVVDCNLRTEIFIIIIIIIIIKRIPLRENGAE